MATVNQNLIKCPVTTLVQDNLDADVDYGHFLSPTRASLIHARGRNVVVVDPYSLDILRTIQTEEELKFARFVKVDGRRYQKSDVAYQQVDDIITVSQFGTVNRWVYNDLSDSIRGFKLVNRQEAGQGPYYFDVLTGTNVFVLADSKGRTQMHKIDIFFQPLKANIHFEKLVGIKMITNLSFVMLGRTQDGRTSVRLVEFSPRLNRSVPYRNEFNEKFRQCICEVYRGMHVLIGRNALKLISFGNGATFDFAHEELIGKRIVHAALLESNNEFFSMVLVEKNGKITFASLGFVPETTQTFLHFLELDQLSYRPRNVIFIEGNRIVITTKGDNTVESTLSPVDARGSYQRLREYGTDSNFRDVAITGTNENTSLVTCSGNGVTGQLQIYRKSMSMNIYKTLDLVDVDKIFSIRTLNTNYDNLIFFSSPSGTLIYNSSEENFLTPRQDINFSMDRTLFLGNLHNENSIVQVVEFSVILIPLLGNGTLGLWQLNPSTIGKIECVDGDLPSGKILYSSQNQIELKHFQLSPVTDSPYLCNFGRRQFNSHVTCLSFFCKDSKFNYQKAEFGLIGLHNSQEIHIIRLDRVSLDTVQTVIAPISSPLSFVSHLDYFVVSDSNGHVVNCHGFSGAMGGFFTVERTPAAQNLVTIRHAETTAVGISASPIVVMEQNDVKKILKLDIDRVIAASAVNVERFGSVIAISTGTQIIVGSLRMNHFVFPLNETPLKLMYHESSNSLAIVTECADPIDPEVSIHKIQLLDGVTFTPLDSSPLLATYLDICCGRFSGTNIDVFVNATGYPSGTARLRFIRFIRAEKRSVEFHQHPLPSKPDRIHFEGGIFYAAVAGVIHTFVVVDDEVKHLFTTQAPNEVTAVAAPSDQLLVAGPSISMESIRTRGVAEGNETIIGMASISDSLVSTVDSEMNLNTFFINEADILEARQKGLPGMVPRGKYWLGTSVEIFKSDRQLILSDMIQPGGQVFFITGTGAVGCIVMLNTVWSSLIDDVIHILREIDNRVGMAGHQSAMNHQRANTTSDFLDGDILRSLKPSRQKLINALRSVPVEMRTNWPDGLNSIGDIPVLTERLLQLCGQLSPF